MRRLFIAAVGLMLTGGIAQAITLGQVDTFQGYTTDWAPGVLQANSGPAGIGDTCLRVSSTGSGDTATLRTTTSSLRWTGDYLAQGVTAIEVDLLNLGSVQLDLRLLLVAPNSGEFTSTEAYALPPDGQWRHARFGISASELTRVGYSSGDLDTVLHRMEWLLLRHQSGAPLGLDWNTPIVSQMAIDNIRAVPEPVSILLCALGGCLLMRKRIHARR